jgi:hypothetical protein
LLVWVLLLVLLVPLVLMWLFRRRRSRVGRIGRLLPSRCACCKQRLSLLHQPFGLTCGWADDATRATQSTSPNHTNKTLQTGRGTNKEVILAKTMRACF